MNILIIGSGAREHAIAKAFSRSHYKPHIYCCGTSFNPGIVALCTAYWFGDITDIKSIPEIAKNWEIKFAIIGPEAPLEKGMSDALWDIGIPVVGPRKKSAQIETSKSFTRQLMQQFAIPGLPKYKIFSNKEGLLNYLEALGLDNFVIKANGLMAGKGVKVAGCHLHSFEEAFDFCNEIFEKGQLVLIEEKLIGQEFSFMCFCDGKTLIPMPIVQDYKRAYVDDKGPNTGGMGSYSMPNHSLPFLTQNDMDRAFQISQLVMEALRSTCGETYKGILYGGFIATATGVYVIEFNARFGDPESLNILSLLMTDFVDLCFAVLEERLDKLQVQFSENASVCKYAVPFGYPDNPKRDVEIDLSLIKDKSKLFLAAVHEMKGRLYATGSRTAAYVGVAPTLTQAEQTAEEALNEMKGPLFHREDIGTVHLVNKAIHIMRELRQND